MKRPSAPPAAFQRWPKHPSRDMRSSAGDLAPRSRVGRRPTTACGRLTCGGHASGPGDRPHRGLRGRGVAPAGLVAPAGAGRRGRGRAPSCPACPSFELDPDLVLVGLLPPLLYAAAIRTSLVDFARQATAARSCCRSGLVAFTTFAVGLVAWWLLPVGLARGGPRARRGGGAARRRRRHRVARRVGLPRRVVDHPRGRVPRQRRHRAGRPDAPPSPRSPRRSRRWRSAGTSCWPPAAASLIGLAVDLAAGAVRTTDHRPGARHHALVRRAVRRVPAGRGDPRLRRARGGGDRPAARSQGAGPAVGRLAASPRARTGAPCSSCSRTRCSC